MVLVRRRNEFVNALVKRAEAGRHRGRRCRPPRISARSSPCRTCWRWRASCCCRRTISTSPACLKSPLIGLGEDELFTLAWKRTGHLWRSLRERARAKPFAAAHARLAGWLRRADYITPFDFFARRSGPEGGRVRLLERLGHEAADPIDELLARALQYQRAEGGSLQGFLRWFEAGAGEIKRDLDQNRRAKFAS
jgi:ATP-dependent helicase/nuclease subunit A